MLVEVHFLSQSGAQSSPPFLFERQIVYIKILTIAPVSVNQRVDCMIYVEIWERT